MHRPNTLQLAVVVVLSFQWLAQGKEAGVKHSTLYRTVQVDGLSIFYREAGPKDAPVLLLLHGLPSSSRMRASLRPFIRQLSSRRAGLSGLRTQRLAGSEKIRVHVRSHR